MLRVIENKPIGFLIWHGIEMKAHIQVILHRMCRLYLEIYVTNAYICNIYTYIVCVCMCITTINEKIGQRCEREQKKCIWEVLEGWNRKEKWCNSNLKNKRCCF